MVSQDNTVEKSSKKEGLPDRRDPGLTRTSCHRAWCTYRSLLSRNLYRNHTYAKPIWPDPKDRTDTDRAVVPKTGIKDTSRPLCTHVCTYLTCEFLALQVQAHCDMKGNTGPRLVTNSQMLQASPRQRTGGWPIKPTSHLRPPPRKARTVWRPVAYSRRHTKKYGWLTVSPCRCYLASRRPLAEGILEAST
jgi:hypothetical protein